MFAFAQRLTIGHDLGGLREDDLLAPTTEGAIGFALALQLYSAILLFDLDRRDEAMARIPHRRGEVPDRPSDYVTVFIDVAAAHVAAEVGDLAAVPVLLDRLAPMAGRWANGGTGAGSLGLVDLAIARLHTTAGNVEQARSCVPRSVSARDRVGAPAWLARSLLHQGVFLGVDGAAALDRASHACRRVPAPDRRRPGRPRPPPRIRQGVVTGRGRILGACRPTPQLPTPRPRPTWRAISTSTERFGPAPLSWRQPRLVPPTPAPGRRSPAGSAGSPPRSRSAPHRDAVPHDRGWAATYPEIAPKLEADHSELDGLLADLTAALDSADTAPASATRGSTARPPRRTPGVRGRRGRAALRPALHGRRVRRPRRPRREDDALQADALHRAVDDVAPRRRRARRAARQRAEGTHVFSGLRPAVAMPASPPARSCMTLTTQRRQPCPTSTRSPGGSTP